MPEPRGPTKSSHQTKVSEELVEGLLLGLLVKASSRREETIRVSDIAADMHALIGVDGPALRERLNHVLREYRWLGLAWDDADGEVLWRVGGVRWFANSRMYEKLMDSRPQHHELARLFAAVVAPLPGMVTQPKLLADAGSTTVHTLFHESCKQLRSDVKTLLTNNLFAALRWQEEFGDKAEAILLGGTVKLNTAATVDHEKLEQWLGANSRQPDAALLSWHYLKPVGNDIILCCKDDHETQVKRAAMRLTRRIVCVVLSHDKVTNTTPRGAKDYNLLAEIRKDRANQKLTRGKWDKDREVYLITDLDEKTAGSDPVKKAALQILQNKGLLEAEGVKFVNPSTYPRR